MEQCTNSMRTKAIALQPYDVIRRAQRRLRRGVEVLGVRSIRRAVPGLSTRGLLYSWVRCTAVWHCLPEGKGEGGAGSLQAPPGMWPQPSTHGQTAFLAGIGVSQWVGVQGRHSHPGGRATSVGSDGGGTAALALARHGT